MPAVDDYSAAYEGHRAEHLEPPADRYSSACQHFEDLVVGELTWENTQAHTDVFYIAKDMFELDQATCFAAQTAFELSGT